MTYTSYQLSRLVIRKENWETNKRRIKPIKAKDGHVIYPIHFPGQEKSNKTYDPEVINNKWNINELTKQSLEPLNQAFSLIKWIPILMIIFTLTLWITGIGIVIIDLLMYIRLRYARRTIFEWRFWSILQDVRWDTLTDEERLKFISYLEFLPENMKWTLFIPQSFDEL